jgi:hypothetical protein
MAQRSSLTLDLGYVFVIHWSVQLTYLPRRMNLYSQQTLRSCTMSLSRNEPNSNAQMAVCCEFPSHLAILGPKVYPWRSILRSVLGGGLLAQRGMTPSQIWLGRFLTPITRWWTSSPSKGLHVVDFIRTDRLTTCSASQPSIHHEISSRTWVKLLCSAYW